MTRHLALVGPTASGKSALALSVARELGDVEIVSLDSMQVYRGMDVGTAKPAPTERVAVPHHLVDVAEVSEEWSVRRTQDAARAAIGAIEARGRRALLVGGTGLYVQAVIDAFAVPGGDPDVRRALDLQTVDDGVAAAHRRLAQLDPAAAARIHPANRRRIVRALEVIEITRRPFSSFGPGVDAYGEPAVPVRLVGVWLPRAELSRRIVRRFVAMRDAGLVDEVRALAGRAGGISRTARQAIGYKEVLAHLAGDVGTLDEALDLAIRRTHRFARRQRVWFRRDPRIHWLATTANPHRLLGAILATWSDPVPAITTR